MKSLILSVKPRHCANILNGLKTKEIRKRFPKDYRGWIYIYCTKCKKGSLCMENGLLGYRLDGYVVARFYCDDVEEIACEQLDNGVGKDTFFYTENIDDIRKDSCLDTQDLINYLGAKPNGEIVGKAIYISKLEIFDTPKELSEFKHTTKERIFNGFRYDIVNVVKHIEKAPQSWVYIETE